MAVQALDAALRQNQGTVLFQSCCLDIALAKKLKRLWPSANSGTRHQPTLSSSINLER
jgi:hypothetical protein